MSNIPFLLFFLIITCSLMATPYDVSLIGYWDFQNNTGNSLRDQVGTAHGTIYGGAQTVAGQTGNALSFDGTDDYVVIPDQGGFSFGSRDFTVSYWIYKRQSSSGWDNCWGVNQWNTGGTPGTNEWALGLSDNAGYGNYFTFAIESGTTAYSVRDTVGFSLNQWYHIVGMRDENYIRLYVNGVEKVSTYVGAIAVNNVGRNLFIATSAINALHTNAMMDELAIWNRAWSDQDVLTLYNSGVASLTGVPEPSAFALLVLGFLAFGGKKIFRLFRF